MRAALALAALLSAVVPSAAVAKTVDAGPLSGRVSDRVQVQVERAGPGVVAVRLRGAAAAKAVSISFAAAPREIFTGFGQRSNAVDQRGRDVLNYTADGPFLARDRALAAVAVPDWAESDRNDGTYYPIPWVLSSRGYGVLVDNDETSRFILQGRRWSVRVQARRLDLRVFAGPRPADALARFTAATGRQPAPPAPWAYGPWVQTGQPNVVPLDEEQRIFRTLRDADAPVSAAETHMRFLPCGVHRANEAYERERTAQVHAFGMAMLTYFSPHLCTSYQPLFDEAAAAGALQQTADGRPLTFSAFVGGQGPSGFSILPLAQFDFTARSARQIYERLLREAVDQGKDGWMEDFGEWTSPEVVPADGTPSARIHNRFPRDYHCAVRDIVRRLGRRPLVRFQRSGWTGAARCSVNVWGGDPTTVWGFDGLRSVVTQALTIGMSGVARWGSDIGGYNSFGERERLTPELLKRWIELGAVSGVMRTKRSGIALPAYERPQVFDPGILPLWRRYTKLHTQLLPYIQAADAAYRATGMPLMRHGLLTHSRDPRAVRAHDQFMFGPDLLAAPVLEPGARRRGVYVPAGHWVDLWRSASYRKRDGSLRLKRASLLAGRRVHELPAPLTQLPLLVRTGAVIPLLSPDVDTLAPYRGGPGVVRLADRRGRMQLLAFPQGRSAAAMGTGPERIASAEGDRSWRLTIRGKRARRYSLQASLATLRNPFAPRSLTVAGRPLRSWSYDRRTLVLRASFRVRNGTLVVR